MKKWTTPCTIVKHYSKLQSVPSRFQLQSPIKLSKKRQRKNIAATDAYKPVRLTKKMEKTSIKESDNKYLSKRMFKYGEIGALAKTDEGTIYKNQSLINKITDFQDLKLLPRTREVVDKVLHQESILFDNKEYLVDGNKDAVVIKPTPIQVLAIKQLTKHLMDPAMKVHAIAADTGSGKTMAYLIPLLDYLFRGPETGRRKPIKSIILVPTHELVLQVYQTLKLCETYANGSINCEKWDSNTSYHDLLDKMKNGIDILVTSSSKLLNLYKTNIISNPNHILNQVEFLVVDEADTLMDPSWIEDTQKIIRNCHGLNQLLFCSATIPHEFNKILNKWYPDCQIISTPQLHKISKKLEFKVIDCRLNPFKGSKINVLAQILFHIKEKGQNTNKKGYEVRQHRCIVFVNEKKHVDIIADELKNKFKFSQVVAISGATPVEERLAVMQDFISVKEPQEEEMITDDNDTDTSLGLEKDTGKNEHIPGSNIKIPSVLPKVNSPQIKILVTTDLLARGMNFRNVRTVVLYDVPKTSIDLVHRAGRTGRMNRGGKVFMIIDKHTKSWARGIPRVVAKNMSLT